jgi:hypothetical protein
MKVFGLVFVFFRSVSFKPLSVPLAPLREDFVLWILPLP